jgi:hypothetical protein
MGKNNRVNQYNNIIDVFTNKPVLWDNENSLEDEPIVQDNDEEYNGEEE